MNNLKKYYQDQSAAWGEEIRRLSRRNHLFILSEISCALCFLFCAIRWAMVPAVHAWAFGVFAPILLWVIISRIDQNNTRKIDELTALKKASDAEIGYLKGDFSPFDAGEDFIHPQHEYSFDLDLFGKDSLFQRLCRCVTTGGRELLAHELEHLHWNAKRPVLIRELAGKSDFLLSFKAMRYRKGGVVDSDAVMRAIRQLKTVNVPLPYRGFLGLLLGWLPPIGFWTVLLLCILGMSTATTVIWWAVILFFVAFAVCGRTLAPITGSTSSLLIHLKGYRQLVGLIGEETFESSYGRELQDALTGAGDSFRLLDRFMQGLDSRSNLLGLFVMDVLFFQDFFLVRRFYRWQQKTSGNLDQWVEQVNRMDALVSMATLACNHPEATTAEIIDGEEIIYEARGIYHPFLGLKAVRNDFMINDRNYYIITGANMAGKSTFLRTIGINYVLALCGMPVFADHLRVTVFRLFTSMRTSDDLTHGISYFNAELLRLQQLIHYCDAETTPTLIILDEILKGTNSLDKLNGSRLFLEAMRHRPVSGIIATHDLELSKMEQAYPEQFHNYCFEIKLGTDVTYTYRITPGVARNQNATYLLNKILEE
ncbi:MutS-related protein [Prevotella sp. AGR2160]|uniref:MutS-related protein n=1 Tax=Prevotella sp. AGR2160 TaxID=1280674 RepID=UPI0003FD1C37|nr:hypothetical protein [Prevotella sp. AGR2160]